MRKQHHIRSIQIFVAVTLIEPASENGIHTERLDFELTLPHVVGHGILSRDIIVCVY